MIDMRAVMGCFADSTVEGAKTGVVDKQGQVIAPRARAAEGAKRKHAAPKPLAKPLPQKKPRTGADSPWLNCSQGGQTHSDVEVRVRGSGNPKSSAIVASGSADRGKDKGKASASDEVVLVSDGPPQEIAPGILSITQGGRPPLRRPTTPEGPDGWSTWDYRTVDGWLGEPPYPVESLRVFGIPADIQRMASMNALDHATLVTNLLGQLNTAVGGINNRAMSSESTLRKVKAMQAESQRLLESESLRVNELLAENVKLKEAADAAAAAKVETEKALASARSEVVAARSEVADLKALLVVKDARIKKVEEDAWALAEESNNAPSYKEMVQRFLGTNGFFRYLNKKASPLFAQGFSALAGFIGEGNIYDPQVHTLPSYCNNLLRAGHDGGEGEQAPEALGPDPEADPEAEFTLEEILELEPREEVGEAAAGEGTEVEQQVVGTEDGEAADQPKANADAEATPQTEAHAEA